MKIWSGFDDFRSRKFREGENCSWDKFGHGCMGCVEGDVVVFDVCLGVVHPPSNLASCVLIAVPLLCSVSPTSGGLSVWGLAVDNMVDLTMM